MRSADTTSHARAVQIAIYRRMSGAQRVALAIEMSEAAQAISRCGARARAAALVPPPAR